ncbi:MAG: tetratricopeptide repeat protein [Verrucomicrobiota bacterium]
MKAISFFALLLALALSLASAAQDLTSEEKLQLTQERIAALMEGLSLADRERLLNHLEKSRRLSGQKRFIDAIAELWEAQKIVPDHPDVLNHMGACYVNVRDFESAKEYFQLALELYPSYWSTEFNLAEIYYVQGDYSQARERFTTFLERYPKIDSGTRDFIYFKLFLCHLMLEEPEKAEPLLRPYSVDEETPFFYYSQMAWAYYHENEELSEEWRNSATRIFSKEQFTFYDDALAEIGWLFAL